MRFNHLLYLLTPPGFIKIGAKLKRRYQYRSSFKKLRSAKRLHLGSGDKIIEDWANIDLVSKGKVIGLDLTKPLPVKSNSIKYVFSEHFVEHITLKQAEAFLSECYRVLQENGVIRISTPSLEKFIEEYLAGKTKEWVDVGWEPNSPCKLLNEGLRSWGHQHVYDANDLIELLEKAEFNKVVKVDWHLSRHNSLRNLESRPYHSDLIIEATK